MVTKKFLSFQFLILQLTGPISSTYSNLFWDSSFNFSKNYLTVLERFQTFQQEINRATHLEGLTSKEIQKSKLFFEQMNSLFVHLQAFQDIDVQPNELDKLRQNRVLFQRAISEFLFKEDDYILSFPEIKNQKQSV